MEEKKMKKLFMIRLPQYQTTTWQPLTTTWHTDLEGSNLNIFVWHKRFKRTLIYYDIDTQSAHFGGNPIQQATILVSDFCMTLDSLDHIFQVYHSGKVWFQIGTWFRWYCPGMAQTIFLNSFKKLSIIMHLYHDHDPEENNPDLLHATQAYDDDVLPHTTEKNLIVQEMEQTLSANTVTLLKCNSPIHCSGWLSVFFRRHMDTLYSPC